MNSIDTPPLIQALMALEIAGAELQLPPNSEIESDPHDFVLSVALSESLTLKVQHDAQAGAFRVISMAALAEADLAQGALLALSLSHLHDAQDRYSLDLATSALAFCRTLPSQGLALEHLAFAVHTAIEVACRLHKLEAPAILSTEPAEVVRPSTFAPIPLESSILRG